MDSRDSVFKSQVPTATGKQEKHLPGIEVFFCLALAARESRSHGKAKVGGVLLLIAGHEWVSQPRLRKKESASAKVGGFWFCLALATKGVS